jgi:uncharacterized protein Yka (UPF0111/DUF47 family)
VGIRFDLGDQGRRQTADQVETLYLAGLTAYSEENYAEAQYYFEETLKLNPKFEPARESLEIIRKIEAVEQQIDDLQRLDF